MSKFLAPIHTWLFNKIKITEAIEKEIFNRFSDEETKLKYSKILQEFGEFIPEEPLENLIDPSNIHGWLQSIISLSERRQAALVHLIPESAHGDIKKVYYEMGLKLGSLSKENGNQPSYAFKELGDVLLEGMPCDRVNQVLDQTESSITWVTSVCVHKENWEGSGVPVEKFYQFRAAFTEGFVKGIDEKMNYVYTNDGQQVHKITL